MKKHKTWDGDGVLHLQKGTGTLYNMEGGKYCISFLYFVSKSDAEQNCWRETGS